MLNVIFKNPKKEEGELLEKPYPRVIFPQEEKHS